MHLVVTLSWPFQLINKFTVIFCYLCDRVEYGKTQVRLTSFAWSDSTDKSGAILDGLFGMKGSLMN